MCQYVSLRKIFDHAVSWQSQILGRGIERIFQDVIEKYYNLRIIRKLIITCKNESMMQMYKKGKKITPAQTWLKKSNAKTRLTFIILINCHGNERRLI